ncbi:hypothetical protein [Bacillus sp. KH172YL63]|uniref:hypothetical protein n=1 Tax=Bacillus sp. KH172YL63 TaxID=2709784 RepID=UPI0013E4B123|nr:hypothetical protein [Bacillus sp. KH172YL63]BCB05287.1 hypothetical protein KH172YL63_34200 [Bacillus sp. KH172YL63]
MKKYLPVVLTIPLLLGACAAPTSTKETPQEEPKKESKQKPPEKEQQNPYQPLEAAEEAVALEDTLKEEGEDAPKRSVPLGETLKDGMEDPSDGPLKDHRLVTYYGTPASEHMGILGQLEPEAYITKLKEQTQVYSDLDPDRPAVPTIELITTMAQNEPGPDGDYVRMTSEENIETYVELAKKHDALVLLDIQLGKDTVMEQVKMVEKWLKLPHVHLAIDTEFHVADGEKPGEDLGQVDGRKIQEAVNYLSALTEKNNLPDKLVLVHQFTGPVLTHKDAIQPTDNVEVAINFDGWGAAADKLALYRKYIRDEPGQYGAFKIFYEKDLPVLTPEEVLKMDPSPAVINYQ